ncbi:hypothetical protein V1264_017906 [Littorina saxatilis]|uniref:Ig-like domain-containing protein n=1 Tax=Littorina saxatilis TaxID=31220 RepID=A0AAN9BK65_9CAEN
MEDLNLTSIFWVAVVVSLMHTVSTTPQCNSDSNLEGMTVEGELLNCTCGSPDAANSTFSWPGYSSGPTLLVPNVRREQNGTHYTCLNQTEGMDNETAVYTLQVAYGPSDNDTVIEGPSSFTSDGTKDLTLTCTAKNVNPSPVYAWPNVNMCANATNKCTFKPSLTDNGREVFCTATNTVLVKTGTAIYKMNIVISTTPQCNSDSNLEGMTVEGELLNCTCGSPDAANSTFSWPGYSSGPTLLVPNVRREQNGTIYTCLNQTEGMDNETAVYTLQVAYGPSDNDTVIEGPSSFATDGTKNLTLTCTAKNVNPSPVYAWPNVNMCANATNKCTFKPSLIDHDKEVFCYATNTVLRKTGTAIYKTNIGMIPAPPVNSDNQGDGLNGKVVAFVVFACIVLAAVCVVFVITFVGKSRHAS